MFIYQIYKILVFIQTYKHWYGLTDDRFALNQYIQYIKVNKTIRVFLDSFFIFFPNDKLIKF